MVGLGQAEAADPLTAGQFGKVFLLLRLGTEFIDRHHDQRRLHAHHRAIARVHPLDLTGNKAVAHIVQATAAELFGDGRTEQTHLAHLAKDGRVGGFVAKGLQHSRHQLALSVLLGRVAHHALFLRELLVQQQWVDPVEACHVRVLGKAV